MKHFSQPCVSGTALTEVRQIDFSKSEPPNTFVSGLNRRFFTRAAAVAYGRGSTRLVWGMRETDYSGYQDCRDSTLSALQVPLNLGLETRLVLDTRPMRLDKGQTWAMVQRLGSDALIGLIREERHSCSLGDRTQIHDWGLGYRNCPGRDLRRNGRESFVEEMEEAL